MKNLSEVDARRVRESVCAPVRVLLPAARLWACTVG